MGTDYDEVFARCCLESRLGQMDQAAASAAVILNAPDDFVTATLRLDVLTRLIWIEFHRGQHQAATDVAISAIALARVLEEPARESVARAYHARVLCEGNDIIKAADEAAMAVRIARSTNDLCAQSIGLTMLAIICAPLGIYDAGVQLAQEAIEYGERSGDMEALCHALINDGSLHGDYLYRLGSGVEAEQQNYLSHAIKQSERAWRLAGQDNNDEMHRLAGFNLVEFSLMANDLQQAESVLAQTDIRVENASTRSVVHRNHVACLMQMARGNIAEAIASLRTAIAFYLDYPFIELAVFSSEYLAQALAKTGDFEGAYHEQLRFQKLSRELKSVSGNGFLRAALIEDQITELRVAISAERERNQNLEKDKADLRVEAERLLEVSLEDPLTGLGNRRKLNMVMSDLDNRAIPYALALLDLDNFKAVNDQHSHLVGDAVIKIVATSIQEIVSLYSGRKGVAIRLGGEEYVAILETAEKAEASVLCEAFRTALENYQWHMVAHELSVTASVGLAMSSEASADRSCLAIADTRLYAAKNQGRNRVVVDDALVL